MFPGMLRKLILRWLGIAPAASPEAEAPAKRRGLADFSTHTRAVGATVFGALGERIKNSLPRVSSANVGMDAAGSVEKFRGLNPVTMSDSLLSWYAATGFIGYQMCAIIAQHWLIDKACGMVGKDAIRQGWVYSLEGADTDGEEIKELVELDKKYDMVGHYEKFVHFGRVFGIRIALFKVRSTDPKYYERPFNIDAVTPGSFEGIVQIDPYWCSPNLSGPGVSDPASPDFYEPMWWTIQGKLYHRSHLRIFRTSRPADLLKPMYLYGGIPIPQQIMERVYAAERTANEAPQLAMTKRLLVWGTDVATTLGNQVEFEQHLANFTYFRDNYGIKINDTDDTMEQHDTSLTDLDVTIMTQYQLVAAAARVPGTKLMGTQPKGFNSNGEYEEAVYREELETCQTHDLTPFGERYLEIVLRSDIEPKFGYAPGSLSGTLTWEPLDSPTAAEEAEINKNKAETDATLVGVGAIDGTDVRDRLRREKGSGYTGIEAQPLMLTGDPLVDATNDLLAYTKAGKEKPTTIAGPQRDPLIAATHALTVSGDALELPHAAGVILTRLDGKTLWVKRRDDAVDAPGVWAWPGGTIDPGEKPQDTAVRELEEETGIAWGAPLSPVGVTDGFVAFGGTTLSPSLDIRLNYEHTEFVWQSLDDPPAPLHPGCAKLLGRG